MRGVVSLILRMIRRYASGGRQVWKVFSIALIYWIYFFGHRHISGMRRGPIFRPHGRTTSRRKSLRRILRGLPRCNGENHALLCDNIGEFEWEDFFEARDRTSLRLLTQPFEWSICWGGNRTRTGHPCRFVRRWRRRTPHHPFQHQTPWKAGCRRPCYHLRASR